MEAKTYRVLIEMEQESDSREHAAEQFVRAIQENGITWTVEVYLPGLKSAAYIEVPPSKE